MFWGQPDGYVLGVALAEALGCTPGEQALPALQDQRSDTPGTCRAGYQQGKHLNFPQSFADG